MTILETLVQLRDDLKTWVTNNLNALNSKIEEKTIPIDDKLNSTSTNPVQNKVISAEINSLKNQEHFSGDYNDLKNAPNISEDNSGEINVTDEAGNIILKVDSEGLHSTNLDLSSDSLSVDGDKFQIGDKDGNIAFRVDETGANAFNLFKNGEEVATQEYVDEAIANIDIPEVDLTGYATETYVDEAIANIDIPEVDLTGYATETYVTEQVSSVKDELSESILSQGEDFKIVDQAGNIAFQVDNESVKVGVLEVNGENVTENFSAVNKRIDEIEIPSIDGLATETYVDEKVSGLVNAAPETLNTLDELAAALGDDANFAATVTEQIGTKTSANEFNAHVNETDGKNKLHITAAERTSWNAKSNFSGDYSDLTNAPNIQEDESGKYTITDESGNIVFEINSNENGVTNVYDLAIQGTPVADYVILTSANVDYAILAFDTTAIVE